MPSFSRLLRLFSLAISVSKVAGDLSVLGTDDAPILPDFVPDSGTAAGAPWGSNTADVVNPEQIPNTGKTRKYHFTASRGYMAPDGVNRSMLLINGQFPGPIIEANWGDFIEVTLTNNIFGPDEGAAIHWHGIRQKGTPYMDGVPSAVQCPIAPGSSFTYRWQADAFGSSFWHSHQGAQYSAGIFGALIIHGPKQANQKYDIDLGPVFLNDWYHANYTSIVESVVGLPIPLTQPYSDNNMINGRNPFPCTNPNITAFSRHCTDSAKYSTFKLQRGKTHLLRLMNVGSQGMQRFSIDGMTMTVIAHDFIPVKAYDTNIVSLGIGQRADVLIKADGKSTDSLWMRSDVSAKCSVSSYGGAKATMYYENADRRKLPTTNATVYDDSWCGNVPLNMTVPLYAMNPPAQPEHIQRMDIRFAPNATGNLVWTVNSNTFRANYEQPILLLAAAKNTSYPNPDWSVYNFGSNSSVRIVLYNYVFVAKAQHPMHLHGHNFFVVAEGLGEWDGTTGLNLNNPMRRDTHILMPGDPVTKQPGYVVLDVVLDNPGVWPLHCHLAWHVSAGLYVNILENPDAISKMNIPQANYQTCKEWTSYNGHDLVPEIDSGV